MRPPRWFLLVYALSGAAALVYEVAWTRLLTLSFPDGRGNQTWTYAPDGKHHATSAAIEFAVIALGVKHVVVMGHGRCGGIRAVVEGGDPLSAGDFIGKWMSDVKDVAEAVRHDHDHSHGDDTLLLAVERASVEHSLANLRTFPWLRMRENKGEVTVHGAWFDISLGELHVFEETARNWAVV